MNGLLSIIGMKTELDYLIGDFPACFGNTPLAIPMATFLLISKSVSQRSIMSTQSRELKSWQLLRMMLSRILINHLAKDINRREYEGNESYSNNYSTYSCTIL